MIFKFIVIVSWIDCSEIDKLLVDFFPRFGEDRLTPQFYHNAVDKEQEWLQALGFD
jgi:hypothetical protein